MEFPLETIRDARPKVRVAALRMLSPTLPPVRDSSNIGLSGSNTSKGRTNCEPFVMLSLTGAYFGDFRAAVQADVMSIQCSPNVFGKGVRQLYGHNFSNPGDAA